MNVVTINNIQIKYDDFLAVEDFSLEMKKGEIVSLFGPSGCGKSTIMKSILSLVPLHQGSISINGNGVQKNGSPVAYTPQDNDLLPWFTVKQNIELWYNDTKSANNKNALQVNDSATLVNLEAALDKYPRELSGGMARRAALARCLSTHSDFMLMDEAFVSVERNLRRGVMFKVRDYIKKNNITTILISHDYEESVFMSDRIILLSPSPTKITKEFTVNLPENREITIFDSDEFIDSTLSLLKH